MTNRRPHFRSPGDSHLQLVAVSVDLRHVGEGTLGQSRAVAELPVDARRGSGRAVHYAGPRVAHAAHHG